MKTVFLLLFSAAFVRGEETQLQYVEDLAFTAKRVVADKAYNAYLQTNLWKKVTGKYVRPQVYTSGWVVSGKVDGTNAAFVLKNPPKDAMQRFLQLKARYQQLKPDYEAVQSDLQTLKEKLQQVELQIEELRADPPNTVYGTKAERRWSREVNQATANQQQLKSREILLTGKVETLKSNIDELKNQGFDLEGDFAFSCYAVRIGLVAEQLPVYDRGRIIPQ